MGYLLLASLLFSFSFGLIKSRLAGVDPSFVAAARLFLSALLFLPFLRVGRVPGPRGYRLLAVGAIQFGAMYVLYQRAYAWLDGHQVALFTVLTPLHVVLVDSALARRVRLRDFLAAALAVLGALVLSWNSDRMGEIGVGFALVQAANLCFAIGQVFYRRWVGREEPHRASFALLYLGGFAVAAVAWLAGSGGVFPRLAGDQIATLLYLGAVPCGLAFFLWNAGATRVSAGTLAALNNAKVPLAIAVAIFLFGEQVSWIRLLGSASLIALAAGMARRKGGDPGDQAGSSARSITLSSSER